MIDSLLIDWSINGNSSNIMKRWSSIPPISTKQTINTYWIKKTITYDIGNPGRVLGQVHKCGGLKSDDNRVLQVKPAGNVSGKTKVL